MNVCSTETAVTITKQLVNSYGISQISLHCDYVIFVNCFLTNGSQTFFVDIFCRAWRLAAMLSLSPGAKKKVWGSFGHHITKPDVIMWKTENSKSFFFHLRFERCKRSISLYTFAGIATSGRTVRRLVRCWPFLAESVQQSVTLLHGWCSNQPMVDQQQVSLALPHYEKQELRSVPVWRIIPQWHRTYSSAKINSSLLTYLGDLGSALVGIWGTAGAKFAPSGMNWSGCICWLCS